MASSDPDDPPGDGNDNQFRDPENGRSLQQVLENALERVIAEQLLNAFERVNAAPAASASDQGGALVDAQPTTAATNWELAGDGASIAVADSVDGAGGQHSAGASADAALAVPSNSHVPHDSPDCRPRQQHTADATNMAAANDTNTATTEPDSGISLPQPTAVPHLRYIVASLCTPLVRALVKCVERVLKDHKSELLSAIRHIVHMGIDQLKIAVAKIWKGMFGGKEFSWGALLTFIAFGVLLVTAQRQGSDLWELMKAVAWHISAIISQMWRAGFQRLGGWLSFLQLYGGKVGEDELGQRLGNAAFFLFWVALFAGGLWWWSWDAGRSITDGKP